TRLIVVVLPEPLGPIRPTISPRLSSAENSSTAMIPPKCLRSVRAAKYAASGGFGIIALHLRRVLDLDRALGLRRDAAVEIATNDRKKAIRGKALHKDERSPKQHEAPFAISAQDLGQSIDDDRPCHGSRQALDAADHRHRDDEAHLREDHHI